MAIFRERFVTLSSGVVLIVLFSQGCETRSDRIEVSEHTQELAAIVKSNPDSEEGKNALAELIEILDGTWRFARCRSCIALYELGPLAAPALPHLMRAATCGDPYVEQESVRALSTIGPAAASALNLLTDIVESSVSRGKPAGLRTLFAVRGLGNMGEPALDTIPLLERATKSDDEIFAGDAQKSLEKLLRLKQAADKHKDAIQAVETDLNDQGGSNGMRRRIRSTQRRE
jgi:hypothetical protein